MSTYSGHLLRSSWKTTALYWVFYLVFFTLMQPGPGYDYTASFTIELISLPPKIVFVSLVRRYLMVGFLFRQRVAGFALLYAALLLGFALVQRLIDVYIYAAYLVPNTPEKPLLGYAPFLYSLMKLQFAVTLPLAMTLFQHWAQEQKKAHEVKEAHSQAELQFLRNQFHPHFLFNALNSLYSKILLKSDESAHIVLKISSMLRFALYDAATAKISLEKEIDFLTDYITLQKIRYERQVEVSFNVDGAIEGRLIEPFILLPFIENSFKYCLGDAAAQGWVTVYLSIRGEWLTAQIENSKADDEWSNAPVAEPLAASGIGLQNVSRRLQILYPQSHSLKLQDNGDSYFVLLKLQLESHAA